MRRLMAVPKQTFLAMAVGAILLLGCNASVQAAVPGDTLNASRSPATKSSNAAMNGEVKVAKPLRKLRRKTIRRNTIRRNRVRRRVRRRLRRNGVPVAAAVGAVIVTGILLNEAQKARWLERYGRAEIYDNDVDVKDCIADYPSFRLSDGTIKPRKGGPRRICPYLID